MYLKVISVIYLEALVIIKALDSLNNSEFILIQDWRQRGCLILDHIYRVHVHFYDLTFHWTWVFLRETRRAFKDASELLVSEYDFILSLINENNTLWEIDKDILQVIIHLLYLRHLNNVRFSPPFILISREYTHESYCDKLHKCSGLCHVDLHTVKSASAYAWQYHWNGSINPTSISYESRYLEECKANNIIYQTHRIKVWRPSLINIHAEWKRQNRSMSFWE